MRAASQADRKVIISTTVQPDHFERLKKMAEDRRVSLAWVAREALEEYLARAAE